MLANRLQNCFFDSQLIMPERKLTYKQTLQMRRNYIGKSCKLHFEVSPLKVVRGSKQYLYDDVGTEYLDCISNVSHVGHCHPQVVHAGQEQMARLTTNYGFLSDQQSLYAKRIIETLPEQLCVAYFVNSGSEANDLALQLAKAYTKNTDTIVVDYAYHGNLGSLFEISPLRFRKTPGGKAEHVHVAPIPDSYRGIIRDDANPGPKYAYEVKKLIDAAHEKGRSISAFIADPTLYHSGVIIPPVDYFNHVFRYVRDAGGVCIMDEVQCGLGRVGDHYWGFQAHSVVPDIVTCGKPIGNGHPMAMVITTKEISNALSDFSSSYGGNPVSCAIGLTVLDIIKNEQLLSAAKSVGRVLMEGYRNIQDKHPMMGQIRGQGMILGVEIVQDQESRKPAREAAEMLTYKMKQHRILIGNDGPDKNVIMMTPPLCFTVENAYRVIQTFDKCLTEIESGVGQSQDNTESPMDIPLSIVSGEGSTMADDDDDDELSASRAKRPRFEDID